VRVLVTEGTEQVTVPSPFFDAGRLRAELFSTRGEDDVFRSLWHDAIRRRYRGNTVKKYMEASDRFLDHLKNRGLRLTSLPEQALLDYLESASARCRHFFVLPSGAYCRTGRYAAEQRVPSACGRQCPDYTPVKVVSYLTAEKALARMFEFAEKETDHSLPFPFERVRQRMRDHHKTRRLREVEDARYPRRALTLEECGRLLAAASHPRDRAVIGLALKTGARHEELLLLEDSDALRAVWRQERLMTVPNVEGVKRVGNPYLVLDDQMLAWLEAYLRWKDAKLSAAPAGDPRRRRLFLGRDATRPMGSGSMFELWRRAGEQAEIRVHPLIDSPLTPHSARHTFCRLLEEAGFEPHWIARLRGDATAAAPELRTSQAYWKRTPEELREKYLEKFPVIPVPF